MEAVFEKMNGALSAVDKIQESIRAAVRATEDDLREAEAMLATVHRTGSQADVAAVGSKVLAYVSERMPKHAAALEEVIPEGKYFKYNGMWSSVMTRISTMVTLGVFFQDGVLADVDDVNKRISSPRGIVAAQVDEFLQGVCTAISELSRYTVNCVTNGDYVTPGIVKDFVSEVFAGFRLLNLRNDGLRRKYDGLKYQVKKIEEVVYDIRVRSLAPDTDVKMDK